jgi:hypothetical protein
MAESAFGTEKGGLLPPNSALAGQALTVELELVIEISKPTFGGDLLLQVLDRAGDIEHFYRTAFSTNQVVLMRAFAETIVSRPAVKPDPPDDTSFLQPSH